MVWDLLNNYNTPIYIATMVVQLPGSNCNPGWQKTGWYSLNPGGVARADNRNLAATNRYWYVYAIASDGTQWTSNAFYTTVRNDPFDHVCISDNLGTSVGFMLVDVNSYSDYTSIFYRM
jgi:hypothetical protein